jgi:hypothetical protein
VLERKFEELEVRLGRAAEGASGGFGASLTAFLAAVAEAVGEISPAFARDLAAGDPRLRAKVLARRQAVLGGTLGRLLEAGRREGAVRADLPAGLLADILIGVLGRVAVPENVLRHGIAPQTMITGILDLFLHGILAPRSRLRSTRTTSRR